MIVINDSRGVISNLLLITEDVVSVRMSATLAINIPMSLSNNFKLPITVVNKRVLGQSFGVRIRRKGQPVAMVTVVLCVTSSFHLHS